MRSRDILESEDRLHREAILRTSCVNWRYLMVHNVLARAFAVDLAEVSNANLPEYLTEQLRKQPARDPGANDPADSLAA